MAVAAKICGIKTTNALEATIHGGAAYVGLNFYAPSPRYITPEDAAALTADTPKSLKTVALTVDATDEEHQLIIDTVNPDLLQLHGKESPERVADIAARFGLPIIKAIAISGGKDLESAKNYQNFADLLLFDAKPPKSLTSALPGGNAISFDWSLLTGKSWDIPWMLSGGLTPENVVDAIRISGAEMVDVSSGVEATRGQKDPALIQDFLDRVAHI